MNVIYETYDKGTKQMGQQLNAGTAGNKSSDIVI